MSNLKSICVYCGSSDGTDPAMLAAAEALGVAMGEAGLALVYGGGNNGLMGADRSRASFRISSATRSACSTARRR